MSKHVSEWLHAYHDGELNHNQFHQVEEHLAECEVCQADLESLDRLSAVLHEVRDPEFTSVERFAAGVNLRLPHKQTSVSRRQLLEFGWWMIPVGLLAAWVFLTTSSVMGEILSAVNQLGLSNSISSWLPSPASSGVYLSATLGQAGLLRGSGLHWAEAMEAMTRTSFSQWSLQISVALLYLSWIAIWLARQTRRAHGPLFGG